MKYITRNVWILSVVSFFTDVATEMLYPVIPVYLSGIGFSMVLIGVLEGMAEATAGLSKGYFGKMSDSRGKRLIFIQLGYGLSALAKPLMVVFTYPLWVFFSRSLDRLGKGVRTGARDALLSDEATPATKGRVFGFHRTIDTLGAVVGPLLALIFLWFKPDQYKTLFYFAFIPGMLALALTYFIREKKAPMKEVKRINLLDFVRYWKESSGTYKKLAGALLLFTLFNSSDVFLLLKVKEAGYNEFWVIGLFIIYNLAYALLSYPFGILADKLGMKKTLCAGLFLFAVVYGGISVIQGTAGFILLFVIYGLYSAATEGVAKAWLSNSCKKEDTATAIGTFTAFQSVAALIASSAAGILWLNFGSAVVFLLSSGISLLVCVFIWRKL